MIFHRQWKKIKLQGDSVVYCDYIIVHESLSLTVSDPLTINNVEEGYAPDCEHAITNVWHRGWALGANIMYLALLIKCKILYISWHIMSCTQTIHISYTFYVSSPKSNIAYIVTL